MPLWANLNIGIEKGFWAKTWVFYGHEFGLIVVGLHM